MERLEEAQALARLADGPGGRRRRSGSPPWPRPGTSKAAEIDAQLAAVAAERAPAAAGLPDDLLALYERLRASKGGVGAAALRARQCGGCRLTVDNAELPSIKAAPSDEVIRCEECQRILVRTAESGL